MNTYEITFKRENGTVGSDRFTTSTEAQARKEFNEAYRHGNGTITSVKLVNADAPATKAQERKALEKIRKIVADLGENGYIGTAFEGCFEIAEGNIENDFGCSMKQRAEMAEEQAEYFKNLADKLREENEQLKAKTLTVSEAGAIKEILCRCQIEAASIADNSAQKIVKLADDTESAEFRQAVQNNRQSKKRLTDCAALVQRLLVTMK